MNDFARLLEVEIPRLRRYARALTRDVARADDLVQSCLTRAVAKQHLWQPGTDLRAWLFTILHNQHVNDVRRSVREGVNVAQPCFLAALPGDRADRRHNRAALRCSSAIAKFCEDRGAEFGDADRGRADGESGAAVVAL